MKKLLERTVFGLMYVAVIVGSLTVLPAALLPVCIVAVCIMLHEFWKVSIGKGVLIPSRCLVCIVAIISLTNIYLVLSNTITANNLVLSSAGLLVPAAIIPFLQVLSHDRFDLSGLAYIYFGLIWIVLPFVTIPLLAFSSNEFDGRIILFTFITIWSSDVGAYIVGSLLGQRKFSKKLAPSISPKKSWWGVAGAVVFSEAAALILAKLEFIDFPFYHMLILGLLICISAIVGDLFESLWKRHFRIKDSGKSIPGHGGFLDRLDSSLVAFPVITIYLTIFNLI